MTGKETQTSLLVSYNNSSRLFYTQTEPLKVTKDSFGNTNGVWLAELAAATGKEMAKLTFILAALPQKPELASVVDTQYLVEVLEAYRFGLERLPERYRLRALANYTSQIVDAVGLSEGSTKLNMEISLDALQQAISIVQGSGATLPSD